jgi:hypothetical protein
VLLTQTSVVRPPTRTVWMPRLRNSDSSDDPWNELWRGFVTTRSPG